MDFSLEYDEGQKEFAREVCAWLEENFPGDLDLPVNMAQLTYEQYQKLRELGKKLGSKGWLAPTYPKEYGGGGLSIDRAIVIELELHKYGVTLPPYYDLGMGMVAPALLKWGTEAQKQQFLAPILRGEVATWQLFTEPEAGSDVANVSTAAVRKGDKFVINGQKIFVGGLHKANQFWLLTRTDARAPRHRNLSVFIVPANLPGITILPLSLIGDGGLESNASGGKNSIFFDDVEVPEFNLVGGENNGWAVANTTLQAEHGGVGALLPNKLVQRFIKYCQDSPLIQANLKAYPELAGEIIDIYISARIEHLFALRNYWLGRTNRRLTYEGPQYSLWWKTQGVNFTATSLKVMGPYALAGNSEWSPEQGCFEWQQRDGIVTTPAGSIEVQKVLMARLLGIGKA